MLLEMIKNSHAFSLKFSDWAKWMWVFLILYRLITVIFVLIFYCLKKLFAILAYLFQNYKAARVIYIIAAVLIVFFVADFFAWNGKIYNGVHVGDIDLSGKTADEAVQIIDDTYNSRLSGRTVTVYSTKENEEIGVEAAKNVEDNPDMNLDEAKSKIQYWQTNAVELDAILPTADIVDYAYNSTRGFNNIFTRIGANFMGQKINPWLDYNTDALNSQIASINSMIGTAVLNPTVSIDCAVATPVDGHNGNLVETTDYTKCLNSAFLCVDSADSHFVPYLVNVGQDISYATAKELADRVNNSLKNDIVLNYEGKQWTIDPLSFSHMIQVSIFSDQEYAESNKSGCAFSPNRSDKYISAYVDSNSLSAFIFSNFKGASQISDLVVSFSMEDSGIVVGTNKDIEVPSISFAVDQINNTVLADDKVYEQDVLDGKTGGQNTENNEEGSSATNIELQKANISNNLTFDEALGLGIIEKISKYTTSYSTGAGSENRNHNIALAASKLNNSICKADGGTWSFNNIAGSCDEAAGFLPAGTIVGTKTIDEAGGGICQVATTVFNCVYDSGLDITSRSPHNTYIASYPDGRDAAISYPSPDLIWKNNTNSDVFLTVESTGYSVEASMYGIIYGYKVESEVGDWVEGDDYKTEVVVDTSKKENSSYIQTKGQKGRSITVKRKVYSKDGTLLRTNEFVSKYQPKTEIRVIGPGEEANQLLANKGARMKDETDKW